MRNVILALVVSMATAPAVVSANTYEIDTAHSVMSFKIRHLGISNVQGSFTDFSGTITADPEKLGETTAEVTVSVASITTGNDQRDDHLRSPEFFDVESHPTLTFKSTGANVTGDGEFTLTGDLTMAGVTKAVTLDAAFSGAAVDPWGNQKVAFSASTKIDRRDFGLTWNKALEAGGFLVGDDVEITIAVEGIHKQDA